VNPNSPDATRRAPRSSPTRAPKAPGRRAGPHRVSSRPSWRRRASSACRPREGGEADATRDAETAEFNAWLESGERRPRVVARPHRGVRAAGRRRDRDDPEQGRERRIAEAEALREKSFVFAESDKQSTMARIASLNAKASALEKKNLARVEQLLAQADTTARNGDSEVRTLEIRRDSTMRRGNARSRACSSRPTRSSRASAPSSPR
jgi:hypothetical protein